MHLYLNTILFALTALTAAYPSSSVLFKADSATKRRSAGDTIAFLQGLTNNRQDMSGKGGDPSEKYFHESTFHPHYDGRFAHTILPHTGRLPHLRALVRSYLSTMHGLGAETWIMHGSLLGWWWNRKIMPWDDDIDVQVSESAISFLASYHNMTVHSYNLEDLDMDAEELDMTKEKGEKVVKRYLLEINPRYNNASTLDTLNVIDARWIDIDTGLFIDITTLRVDRRADQYVDADSEKFGEEDDAEVAEAFSNSRQKRRSSKFLPKDASAHSGPQHMYCKDKHTFLSSQIYPLRTSVFEGVPVRIPYAYQELLVEEYGADSLTSTDFWKARYQFEQKTLEWVPMSIEKVQTRLEEQEKKAEKENLKAMQFVKWSIEQEEKRKMMLSGGGKLGVKSEDELVEENVRLPVPPVRGQR